MDHEHRLSRMSIKRMDLLVYGLFKKDQVCYIYSSNAGYCGWNTMDNGKGTLGLVIPVDASLGCS